MGEAYFFVIDGGFMRRIVLVLTVLSGPLARRKATRLAETVLGVKTIRNRLSVVNTQTAEIPAEK
jgi:hypothetical protein